jgi:hypothetical protein
MMTIASAFDVRTMLDPEEVAAFLQSTQPKEWAKLVKQCPGGAEAAMESDDEGEVDDPIEAELERIQKARQKLHSIALA